MEGGLGSGLGRGLCKTIAPYVHILISVFQRRAKDLGFNPILFNARHVSGSKELGSSHDVKSPTSSRTFTSFPSAYSKARIGEATQNISDNSSADTWNL